MNRITNTALSLLASVALLAGCATTAHPGGGVGAGYMPVVDMKGVDTAQYNRDLYECQQYANQVSPGENAAGAAVAGALFGAALSAALGGHSRANTLNAGGGAVAAGTGAAVNSLKKQQDIIGRCLAGRGYRVLG